MRSSRLVVVASSVAIVGGLTSALVIVSNERSSDLRDARRRLVREAGRQAELEQTIKDLQKQLSRSKRDARGRYPFLTESCVPQECLLADPSEGGRPIGVASLTGYYTRIRRSAWGETTVCDAFVVTGGERHLARWLRELVEQGNTVHSLDRERRPVINLDLEPLSGALRGSITRSGQQDPVRVHVLIPPARGTSAPVCSSFVHVLRVD